MAWKPFQDGVISQAIPASFPRFVLKSSLMIFSVSTWSQPVPQVCPKVIDPLFFMTCHCETICSIDSIVVDTPSWQRFHCYVIPTMWGACINPRMLTLTSDARNEQSLNVSTLSFWAYMAIWRITNTMNVNNGGNIKCRACQHCNLYVVVRSFGMLIIIKKFGGYF